MATAADGVLCGRGASTDHPHFYPALQSAHTSWGDRFASHAPFTPRASRSSNGRRQPIAAERDQCPDCQYHGGRAEELQFLHHQWVSPLQFLISCSVRLHSLHELCPMNYVILQVCGVCRQKERDEDFGFNLNSSSPFVAKCFADTGKRTTP